MRWAIVSGAYASVGGVSDYTRQVATGLAAAGDDVTVYAPLNIGAKFDIRGVRLAAIRKGFSLSELRRLDEVLTSTWPDRVLIQYVPHAFGWRAMNVPFCLWLYARRRHHPIYVMFHEVATAWEPNQALRHKMLAAVTHFMALLLVRSATRVFVSIPAWERMLQRMLGAGPQATWLPVPSNVPVVENSGESARIRKSYAAGGQRLIGHFGAYGRPVAELLMDTLPLVLEGVPNGKMLLLGINSDNFERQFAAKHPELASRVQAAGPLSAADLSCHLSACDLLVQPYPDGVTTRRTSVMAGLSHGIPVVTTTGALTEPFWEASRAVLLSPADACPHLAHQVSWLVGTTVARRRLGAAGKTLYEERFALAHTIAALRAADGTVQS